MNAAGIIAEYNPFHNGHAFLLSEAKKSADAVVVAMSGNFTQRAESALLCDRCRAKMALSCGADLVLQLPVAYAVASAQTFARGGVSLLAATGLVRSLYFGSECGDTLQIERTAQAVLSPEADREIAKQLTKGVSYPTARTKAVEALYGEQTARALKTPNDILATEYVRAVLESGAGLMPTAVLRQGAAHDAQTAVGQLASASFLREQVKAGKTVAEFMPAAAFSVLQEALRAGHAPSAYQKLEPAILCFLRTASADAFAAVPDAAEGLQNRILAAARQASSLADLFDRAKTKCYTHARIRRVVLSAFLGLSAALTVGDVPYIRVLGATAKGIELVRQMQQTAAVPVLLRASDARALTGRAKDLFAAECRATDLYNLTLPHIRPTGTEMTDSILFLQDS